MHLVKCYGIVLGALFAALASTVDAQYAGVGKGPGFMSWFYDKSYYQYEGGFSIDNLVKRRTVDMRPGDPLKIEEGEIWSNNSTFMQAYGLDPRVTIQFYNDYDNISSSSWIPDGIWGLRVKHKVDGTLVSYHGTPIDYLSTYSTDNLYSIIALNELQEKEIYYELLGQSGNVVGRFDVQLTGGCRPCKTGCSPQPRIGSVDYEIPIGTSDPVDEREGQAVTLQFYQNQIALVGSESFKLIAPFDNPSVVPVYGANGVVQSVRVGDKLAQVEQLGGGGQPLSLKVTISSDYQNPATTVIRTVTIQNKTDQNQDNYLEFNDEVGNESKISSYWKNAAGDWIMETGNGLRRETRTVTETTTQRTVRKKVEERIAAANGTLPAVYATVSDELTQLQASSFGWQEVLRIEDPDGLALTTTTTHGEQTGPSYLDGSPTAEGYGKVKQVVHPSGEIENHYYFKYPESEFFDSGHVIKRAFAGTQDARETTIDSFSGISSETGLSLTVSRITERVSGQIVAKKETSHEARVDGSFTEERVYSSASEYAVTYTFSGFDGTTTVVNPDGTASISSSSVNAQSGFTTAVNITGYVLNDPATGDPVIEPVTRTESVTDKYGEEIMSSTFRYQGANQMLVSRKLATAFDANHRATRFEHFVEGNDDPVYVTEREYGCCGVIRERDQKGIDTHYAYDALGRVIMTNRAGITSETVRTGLTVSQHRYAQTIPPNGMLTLPGSADSFNEISRSVSNLLGDTIEEWSRSPQDGTLVKTTIQTTYNIGDGIGRRVVTLPPAVTDDGAVTPSQTDFFFLDGNPASSTGNLGPNRGFRYSATAIGSSVESFLMDGAAEKENTITQSDWARRQTSITYSSDQDGVGGNDHSDSYYNAKGQLSKTVDPDGVTLLYGYNLLGERTYTALDLDNNGVIDLASDRVSFSETDLAQRQGGEWVMRTTRKDWLDAGSGTGTVTSYDDVSLDGLRSWSIQNPTLQAAETITVTTLVGSGNGTQVLTRPDNTSQTTTMANGLVTSVAEKDANGVLLHQTTNGYDSLNRLQTRTDSRTGTSTQYYVSTTTDVVNRTVDNLDRETLFTYDHRGRQKTTDLPDTVDENDNPVANVSLTHHFPDGKIQEQTGDGNYRTTWTYDYAGRAATMTTYGTATAVTRWVYDSSRGFLTGKLYNSPTPGYGTGPSYTYTAGGRVKTRTQARLVNGNPLVTTYAYGTATGSCPADLDLVTHTDGTPGYTVTTRDRLGRAKVLQDAAGSRSFDYTRHGALESETFTSGILAGQKIEQGFDALLRTRTHAASFGTESLGVTTYGYGPSGAVGSVSGNGNTASYFYHSQQRTLENVTYTSDGEAGPMLQSTRKHDAANRLTRITTHVNDAGVQKPVDHHAYGYDALDRIDSHADITGAAWTYGYNARGEVGKAVKKLPGGTTEVNGRAYRYHFDGIGNRTLVEQSRDSGQTARGFGYTPDALNQYSAITHPSFVDVAGSAAPAANVTVNSASVTRQGGYFRKELSGDNASGPQWLVASITDGTTTTDGSLALPAASVSPQYDEDGNLKSDGLWIYTWDAENRLIRCERSAALVTVGASYLRIEYAYDSQGRRIRSSSFSSSGATNPASQILYIFDGWKCVAELDALSGNQTIRKYTWGLDLAGDAGDSSTGNIGALLWLVDTATNKTHIHLYDRNGNVSGLVDAATRKRSATYEYDAFGQLTVCYGSYAKNNPFTFSTKFTDYVTGLCYYGYRWYSPMHGRWINRDPIGESGGVNLYGFVGNNGIVRWDYLGQRGFLTFFADEGRAFYGQVGSSLRDHAVAIGSGLMSAAGQELYYIGEGPFSYFDRNMNRLDSTSRDVEDIFNGLNHYIDDPNYRNASNEFIRSEADQIAAYLDAASRDPDCLEELLLKANVATIEALIVQLATKGIGAGTSAADLRIRAALQRIRGKAAKGPVIIGENMNRVNTYAGKVGGETIDGWLAGRKWTQSLNDEFVGTMKAQGRQIQDIGPDFGRRLQNRIDPNFGRPPSSVYGGERQSLLDYGNYQQLYERAGKYQGGVPGFDP